MGYLPRAASERAGGRWTPAQHEKIMHVCQLCFDKNASMHVAVKVDLALFVCC